MKTQGISFVTPKVSEQAMVKGSNASEKTSFDSFIGKRTTGEYQNQNREEKDLVPAAGKSDTKKGDTVKMADSGNRVKLKNDSQNSNMTPKDGPEVVDEQRVAVAITVVTVVIQTNFQIPAEDVEDLVNQIGMDMENFVRSMLEDPTGANTMEFVQDLVMKFHGITDKAVVLTSDSIGSEIETLAGQIAEALSSDFQIGEEITDDFQGVMDEQNALDGLEVVVEKAVDTEGNNSESGDPHAGERTDTTIRDHADDHHTNVQSAGAQFVESMAQATAESTAESVAETQQTMSRIVEQIVTQVRIRVMPETTNMELQLHPASLGRVILQVATTATSTTATLMVENQIAKEALESQMITLKQTFEEQGLKVDAVEVTVSEFGLNQEGREAGREQQGSGQHNRRFRFDEDGVEEFSGEEMNETASERRDINSMVDYTA